MELMRFNPPGFAQLWIRCIIRFWIDFKTPFMSYRRSLLPHTALCFSILSLTLSCAFSKRTCLNLLENARRQSMTLLLYREYHSRMEVEFVMKEGLLVEIPVRQRNHKNIIYSGAAFIHLLWSWIMSMYAAGLEYLKRIFLRNPLLNIVRKMFIIHIRKQEAGIPENCTCHGSLPGKDVKTVYKKVVSPDVGIIP